MSVTGFFGTPGCGKTTLLAKIAKKEKKNYKNIYTINVDIKGCIRINKDIFEKYKLPNSLILWDEITLDYDNRDFKNFSQEAKESWLLHRHTHTDIIYFTQNWENVDKKIKDITLDLWYIDKSVVPLLREFSRARRVIRCLTITENNSDLIMGYRFTNILERIFDKGNKIVFRRLYYKYFDSFDELQLKNRKEYLGYEGEMVENKIDNRTFSFQNNE